MTRHEATVLPRMPAQYGMRIVIGCLALAVLVLWLTSVLASPHAVVLLPGRTGSFQAGPSMGKVVTDGDPARCTKFDREFRQDVDHLRDAFRRLRRFANRFAIMADELAIFDARWRTLALQRKQDLFESPVCARSRPDQLRAMMTWRDVLHLEREVVSAMYLRRRLVSAAMIDRISRQLALLSEK